MPAAPRHERRPPPARAQVLLAGLSVATVLFAALSLALPHESTDWLTFALLLVFVIAADRLELYAGRAYDMRVATVPMIAAALLLPPAGVMACGFAFFTHGTEIKIPFRQRLFNGCNHALSGLVAWGVVHLLASHADRAGAALAGAGVAATLVYALCTWGLLVSILHLTRDLAFAEMRQQVPALLTAELGLGSLGIVVAGLWHTDRVLVPLAIAPLALLWTSLKISELRQEAKVDAKTGLFNARHLRGALDAELDRASRYERPLSLLLADLDFLREINNTYGHLTGDEVLAGIGDVLRAEIRSTDVAARFGGEEFVVVLPETPGTRALQLAERIRRAVEERTYGRAGVRVTISIGVASFPADASTQDELLDAADAAVYVAKARGRNRVCVAEQAAPAA